MKNDNGNIPDSTKRIGQLIRETLRSSKPPRRPRSGTFVRAGLTLADLPKSKTDKTRVA